MKNKKIFLVALSLCFISPACGTDVGNSGKPIVSEGTQFAALVGMGHDEVISAIADQSDQDAEPSIAFGLSSLTADPLTSMDCAVNPIDGSLDLTRRENLENQSEFGQAAKRKVLSDTLDNTVTMNFSVPTELGTLSCGPAPQSKPIISWKQLAGLKTSASFEKVRQRSVTLKSDGSILNQSQLNVSSKREVQFAKVAASLDSLTLRRTSSFSSRVLLQSSKETSVLSRTIETLAGEPLILEKTRTRRNGITAVSIVSGAVASTQIDEKTIVLRYKNLLLSTGSSCHPTSGSISGEILINGTTSAAENSFVVEFTSDGARIQYADGSEEDLELENCRLQ